MDLAALPGPLLLLCWEAESWLVSDALLLSRGEQVIPVMAL